jgi:hypothetical protein
MLFRRFQISKESIECALGRRLSGDPSRGELGVLSLLNKGRLAEVRQRLGSDVGPDFRTHLLDHLDAAAGQKGRVFRAHLAPEAWQSYLEETWTTGESLDTVLSRALQRDWEQRRRRP